MVGDFIRDNVIRAQGCKISHKALYENYVRYCFDLGVKPNSKNKFGRMMNEFGYGANVNYCGVRMHKGIRLRKE